MSDALTLPNPRPKQYVDLTSAAWFPQEGKTVFASYFRDSRNFSCDLGPTMGANLPRRHARFRSQFPSVSAFMAIV
jgi:hypothetical protein